MFNRLDMDYSQRVLMAKINEYQRLKKRPLISTTGYCHGLAVLWLSKMVEQKVEWFYDTVKYIIHRRPEDYDEVRFEKFLALIEFGQNPLNSGMNITQRHLRLILEMRNIESIDFSGTHSGLFRRIRPKKHPAMYLVTHELHAIAMFHRGDNYYVYDSNYLSGEAKVFDSNIKAASEVMACLLSEEKRADDYLFDLTLNYIPLAGYLSHPSYEVAIDMSENEDGYEADAEESFANSLRPSCHIL